MNTLRQIADDWWDCDHDLDEVLEEYWRDGEKLEEAVQEALYVLEAYLEFTPCHLEGLRGAALDFVNGRFDLYHKCLWEEE